MDDMEDLASWIWAFCIVCVGIFILMLGLWLFINHPIISLILLGVAIIAFLTFFVHDYMML